MNELLAEMRKLMEAEKALGKLVFEKKAEIYACLNDDAKPELEKREAMNLLQLGAMCGHDMEPAE